MTSTRDYIESIRASLDRIEAAGELDDTPRFEMAWRQMDSMAHSLAVVATRGVHQEEPCEPIGERT